MDNYAIFADNIYLTSPVDRILFDIKIDITKIHSPWVVSTFKNIVNHGYFRCNRVFYQKGKTNDIFRRVYDYRTFGSYSFWPDYKNKQKILTLKQYLIKTDEESSGAEKYNFSFCQ